MIFIRLLIIYNYYCLTGETFYRLWWVQDLKTTQKALQRTVIFTLMISSRLRSLQSTYISSTKMTTCTTHTSSGKGRESLSTLTSSVDCVRYFTTTSQLRATETSMSGGEGLARVRPALGARWKNDAGLLGAFNKSRPSTDMRGTHTFKF